MSEDTNKFYTITEVAEKTDVEVHTLRYWESKGLLNPTRTATGRRRYCQTHITEINRLKKMMNDEKLTTIAAKKRLKKINSNKLDEDGSINRREIKNFLKEVKTDIKNILKKL